MQYIFCYNFSGIAWVETVLEQRDDSWSPELKWLRTILILAERKCKEQQSAQNAVWSANLRRVRSRTKSWVSVQISLLIFIDENIFTKKCHRKNPICWNPFHASRLKWLSHSCSSWRCLILFNSIYERAKRGLERKSTFLEEYAAAPSRECPCRFLFWIFYWKFSQKSATWRIPSAEIRLSPQS